MKLALFFIIGSVCLQNIHAQAFQSDGTDFFIGYIAPSYNSVASDTVKSFFGAYVLVSSYSDNNISVSYFDKKTGIELVGSTYFIPARTGKQIPLDLKYMQMTDSGEVPEYAACHITAKRTINVEFFSSGACSGGSYLAIQTPVLGAKYVVASYNDNPGKGALLGAPPLPDTAEISRGCFLIIAPTDSTIVTITPNATTMRGHIGVNSGPGATGIPKPYTKLLMRGQCYLVKSGSGDSTADISGSTIESNHPIAVLGAHENAYIGSMSGRNLDARNFMIEEMFPVWLWDKTGYVLIPLKDSYPYNPYLYDGFGENYRTYSFDTTKVECYDHCTNSPVEMMTRKYSYPVPERKGVVCPVEFTSTDGNTFGVTMYDNRNFAQSAPFPAPEMMTIIPISKWSTQFDFYVPSFPLAASEEHYVNIIADTNDLETYINGLVGSYNGGQIKPIRKIMTLDSEFQNIPNHPELAAYRFKLQSGSYFVHLPHPFIIYSYGFAEFDADKTVNDYNGAHYYTSYATPAGFGYGISTQNEIGMRVDTFCSFWNVCAHDTNYGLSNSGIKQVDLIDGGDCYPACPTYRNCYLDRSLDTNHTNSIIFSGSDSDVCFKVLINRLDDSAFAPLFIVDDQGSAMELELHYYPPQRIPVSATYFGTPVGKDSCTQLIFKNPAKTGTRTFHITDADLLLKNPSFSINKIIPPLPANLSPGDSIIFETCFAPNDVITQRDTLIIRTDCFSEGIALTGSTLLQSDVKTVAESSLFSISPNPASGNSVIISFPEQVPNGSISIFDVLGREVFHQDILENTVQLQVPLVHIASGLYYVRLQTGNTIVTRKLEVSR